MTSLVTSGVGAGAIININFKISIIIKTSPEILKLKPKQGLLVLSYNTNHNKPQTHSNQR